MHIYADRGRHLVTVPYDRATLLAAADALDIAHHWYHADATHAHIDIPKRQLARVLADPRVTVVSSRMIVRITRELPSFDEVEAAGLDGTGRNADPRFPYTWDDLAAADNERRRLAEMGVPSDTITAVLLDPRFRYEGNEK